MTAPMTIVTRPTPRSKIGAAFAMFRNRKSITGLAILGFFVLVAIFADVLAPYSPTKVDPTSRFQPPPSPEHWLGTTHIGEDVLSQVIVGTRGVILVGFLAAIIATLVAIIIGVISGYLSGWRSEALSALTNVFLVIPGLPPHHHRRVAVRQSTADRHRGGARTDRMGVGSTGAARADDVAA